MRRTYLKHSEPFIRRQVKIYVSVTNLVTFSVFLKSVYISTKGYLVYGSYGVYIVVGNSLSMFEWFHAWSIIRTRG